MANAPRDNNYIPAKMAVLNTDTVQGQHIVPIEINSNNQIKTNATATISFTMESVDPKDDNYVGCWLFQGSDGKTYPAVSTSAGELLIDTT